jgi:hypothetical protein
MTAPAPLGQNVINNHIAKRAPSRHDDARRRLGPPLIAGFVGDAMMVEWAAASMMEEAGKKVGPATLKAGLTDEESEVGSDGHP